MINRESSPVKKELMLLALIVISVSIFLVSRFGTRYFNTPVQYHYTLISPFTFLFWIIMANVTMVFTLRAIILKFKNRPANVIMIVSLVIMAYVVFQVMNL